MAGLDSRRTRSSQNVSLGAQSRMRVRSAPLRPVVLSSAVHCAASFATDLQSNDANRYVQNFQWHTTPAKRCAASQKNVRRGGPRSAPSVVAAPRAKPYRCHGQEASRETAWQQVLQKRAFPRPSAAPRPPGKRPARGRPFRAATKAAWHGGMVWVKNHMNFERQMVFYHSNSANVPACGVTRPF